MQLTAQIIACAVLCGMCWCATPNAPSPSIAIFASPLVDCPAVPGDLVDTTSCIRDTYVRWLEAAGIRVVPLQWDASLTTKLDVMRKVNGVLFAGGSLDVKPAYYHRFRDHVCEVVTTARDWNARGDPFLLWGTCQGFQMISACIAGTLDVVHDGFVGLAAKMIPLNVTVAGRTSEFIGSAPADIAQYLRAEPSTLNYHHEGVLPSSFAAGTPLGGNFTVTSTNMDLAGRQFVSTIEGKHDNIFATQWHPEWPPFDWSNDEIGKTDAAVFVSQWVSRFVRQRLQRNNHTFSTAAELEAAAVNQNPESYQGFGRYRFWIGAQPRPKPSTRVFLAAIVVFAVAVSFVAGVATPAVVAMLRRRMAPARKATDPDLLTTN